MTGLDRWLLQATRHLSRDSTARVRTEIQEHYEAGRDAAICGGASEDEAEQLALTSLGDAKTANCQYRQVLLTSAEARMLREGNQEARLICSRPWLKGLALAVPVAAVVVANALFLAGAVEAGRVVLITAIGLAPLFAAPILPIYTPFRSRIFRRVKWTCIAGALALIFGADALKLSWLLVASLWPLVWNEWTRASIRRKLPVQKWPEQLYI